MTYLTPEEAKSRLAERFDIRDATLFPGDLDAASDALDSLAPFVGEPSGDRQFPRDGEEIPAAILDWVALRAYQLSTDEEPAVTSEGAGGVSVSYAAPKMSQNTRRMARMLAPYLWRTGRAR